MNNSVGKAVEAMEDLEKAKEWGVANKPSPRLSLTRREWRNEETS